MPTEQTARNQTIRQLAAQEDLSYRSIAARYGISRQRVAQIAGHKKRPPRYQVGQQTRLAIYHFIVAYMTEHCGLPPNYKEIMAGVGLNTTSTLRFHLVRLAEEGKIAYVEDALPGQARNFYLPGATWTPPEN
jgi:hypothetical protein